MHVEIYNKGGAGIVNAFRRHLKSQCDRVGIAVTFGGTVPLAGEHRIAVVFARDGSKWTEAQEQYFESLLKNGIMLLPVIPTPPEAQFLPKAVGHINAYVTGFFGDAWAECLADEILSMIWLNRRTPKVFISYKRTDSAPIAAQLYDRLNHLGYETFLDEASVPRGADFQRELKWWLNDADLLIVLASPRFPLSKWCLEEVSFCQQRFVGIAAVEWPRAIYEGDRRIKFPQINKRSKKPVILARAQPQQIVTLTPEDFSGKPPVRAGRVDPKLPERQLSAEGLSKVLKLCARQRTVGIQQRLDNLIPLAQRLLPGAAPVGGAFGPADLSYLNGSVRTFVRVLPFRPRPESIRQACLDSSGQGKVAGCFYAENDPLDPRAKALRWLANGTRGPDPELQSDGWLWASCGSRLL